MSAKLRTTTNEYGETVILMRRMPVQCDAGPMLALVERLGLSGPLLEICREHNVLLEHVLVGIRTKNVVLAREKCCMHLRTLGMSYPEIASVLGMDPSSPLSAIRRLKKRLEKDGDKGPST